MAAPRPEDFGAVPVARAPRPEDFGAVPVGASKQQSKIPGVVDYNPGVGLVEGAVSLGSGAAGAVAGGISGLGTMATNALGLTNTPPGDRVRQVSEAMTYAPRTAAGRRVVETVAAPFEALARGADVAGGAVTDITGSPAAGTAVNTLINAAPMALGPAARAIPRESPAAVAARQRAQALNAPTEAGVAAAREAGLKITPSEAGAGPIARVAEGLSGEPKLAKLASKKNAPAINDLIRKDVGLPDDVPLSREALAAIRTEAGAQYEVVKNAGRFDTDARYRADLHETMKSVDTAAKDFAHRKDSPLKEKVDGLNIQSMDAASAVEEVKLLRADADKAFRTGDKQLGGAYKKLAQAVDDQLDRHLKKMAMTGDMSGDPATATAITRYQAARQRIAKTYAAERALNDTTGNIDAAVYAAELKKGKPLTGEGRQVAEFAQQFPRSMQRTERIGSTGPTIFDLLLGGGAGVVGTVLGGTPGAAGLAMGAARPAMRSALLSDPVQTGMTRPRSYGQPGIRGLQDVIGKLGTEAGAVGVSAGATPASPELSAAERELNLAKQKLKIVEARGESLRQQQEAMSAMGPALEERMGRIFGTSAAAQSERFWSSKGGQMLIALPAHAPEAVSPRMLAGATRYVLSLVGATDGRFVDPERLVQALKKTAQELRGAVVAELIKQGRVPALEVASEAQAETTPRTQPTKGSEAEKKAEETDDVKIDKRARMAIQIMRRVEQLEAESETSQ